MGGQISKLTKNLYFVFAFMSVSTQLCLAGASLQQVADFFISCRKDRGVTEKFRKVLDFRALSKGESPSRLCVYRVNCSIPAKSINHEDSIVCGFDEVNGCEDFDSCLANLPKREENSFSMALVDSPGVAQKCKNNTEEHVLSAAHRSNPDKYTTVCVKDLTCTNEKGIASRHPVVACSPLPQTKKMRHTDGKDYEFDVCPKNDTCLANQIDVKLEADFIRQLADIRKMTVIDTLPHLSSPTLSTSPLKGSHQEIVVP